ncbi:MAG: beta-Ala-His dipeptidase [Eubacterium sp.]|nr:beta-Ala-His dipeptidase [Eubacterium sp.]
MPDDEFIIDDFIENFKVLAAVPRPSKHEQRVSNRLKEWFEEAGFEVRRNLVRDLFIDIPATPGYEELPLTILQSHIDMVCVAADGNSNYDPVKDPIRFNIDKKQGIMTADGTSLGADDGAGVALIMSIVKGKCDHGPLRIILTTDEESGMSGALAVTAENLAGAKYLINIDSEESDTVTVGSAACTDIIVTKKPEVKPSKGKKALMLTISGLLGGHSGLEIGENRCNAIIAMAKILNKLGKHYKFGLASLSGGTAINAIPARSEAEIVVKKSDIKEIRAAVKQYAKKLKKKYKGTEPNFKLTVKESDTPPKPVLKRHLTDSIMKYIIYSWNGAFCMSENMEGLIDSSSNLGTASINKNEIRLVHMARGSSGKRILQTEWHQKDLGMYYGLDVEIHHAAKAWPVNPDSWLVSVMTDAYRELFHEEMKVEATHGGLECGAFAALNGELDMISIGADIKAIHSPDETLYLASVPKVFRLIEKTLANLK